MSTKFSRDAHEVADRFWSHVDKRDAGECWLWRGGRDYGGYGAFKARASGYYQCRAHRFSWILANGAVPDGLWVLHRCDNPPCCNPSHLFLGTHDDNMADMVRKGRPARGDRNGSCVHPESRQRGEGHPLSKLNAEQVREIRALRAGGATLAYVAARFGVTARNVSAIYRRHTWRHVDADLFAGGAK